MEQRLTNIFTPNYQKRSVTYNVMLLIFFDFVFSLYWYDFGIDDVNH